MSKPIKIYFDLDGVLADFYGGLFPMFNYIPECSYPDSLNPFYEHIDQQGITPTDLWEEILDEVFWRGLEPIQTGVHLWTFYEVDPNVRVYICSSAPTAMACKGKFEWVSKYLVPARRSVPNKLILTRSKHLLADDHSILIDDFSRNCEDFTEAGGWSLLFRPEKLSSIIHEIKGFTKSIRLKENLNER